MFLIDPPRRFAPRQSYILRKGFSQGILVIERCVQLRFMPVVPFQIPLSSLLTMEHRYRLSFIDGISLISTLVRNIFRICIWIYIFHRMYEKCFNINILGKCYRNRNFNKFFCNGVHFTATKTCMICIANRTNTKDRAIAFLSTLNLNSINDIMKWI